MNKRLAQRNMRLKESKQTLDEGKEEWGNTLMYDGQKTFFQDRRSFVYARTE
jgi:hypothetical protein